MIKRDTKSEPGFIIYVGYTALAQKVLIAWKLKIPEVIDPERWAGEWRCYCCDVRGINHDHEISSVLHHGDPVGRSLAEFLFKETISHFCEHEKRDYKKLQYVS